MKKISKIHKTSLLLVLLLLFVGCRNNQPCYVENDLSGIIVNGEKYVPIELDNVIHSSNGESLGVIRPQRWNIFSVTLQPCFVDAPISMLYSSTNELGANYFVPESKLDEYTQYIENLEWSDRLFVRYEKELELSERLSYYLIHEHLQQQERIEYYDEWNAREYRAIAQYDKTGSFYREIGIILVRAQGDCYFFEGGVDYHRTSNFYPEGEEYDQITEKYKDLQIPKEFWEELNSFSNH